MTQVHKASSTLYAVAAFFSLLQLQTAFSAICQGLDTDGDGIDEDCTGCPSGYYISSSTSLSGSDTSECVNCPGGFFASNTGSSSCGSHIKCVAGKYVYQNSTASVNRGCIDCAGGKYSTEDDVLDSYPFSGSASVRGGGVASCSDCPLGWWTTSQSTECEACEQGKYLDEKGTSTQSAASNCKTCPDGYWAGGDGGNSSCELHTKCGAGEYVTLEPSTVRDRSCDECVIGKYSSSSDVSNSNPVKPAATAILGGGVTSCKVCAGGLYQNEEGSTGCKYW